MQQPTRLISTPFAQEGEKTEIQNVTGEFDNSATYQLGFPPLTMRSIRLGGKPPKGTDFNGILFDITENISFLCKGGRYQYNAGLSTLIGGYPEGSNLLLDDNVTEVVSTVAGNQNNPNTDMTGWTFKPNKTTAEYVLDASGETQQQVNYNGGSKWHSRDSGYLENERVVLTNGDIVKSTIDGNANDPDVDMTGWVYSSLTPSNNLSDVEDKAEARTNLDVYSKDEVNDAITTSVPIVADATTIDKGIVRLATESDITTSSETAAVTPKNVADMLVGIGSLAKGFRALFSARLTQMTGSNTSTNRIATCTITAHGLSVGDVVSVNYVYNYRDAGGQRITDTVTVTSVANANTFTFTSPQNASGSSSAVACTLYYAIKNNYNVNSLAINSVGRYTISINAASGITGTSFIPFIQATTADNSLVIVQPEAITSATSLTVRTFNAAGTAISPQWLHIGVTQ